MDRFKYYIVLGAANDPYLLLSMVIKSIQKQFNVVASSKFYYGPAEGPNSLYSHFMNVAILIVDDAPVDSIKQSIQKFETYNSNLEKLVDIDLLIQTNNDDLLFISNKIKYCHALVTLNDLCPNLKISDQMIHQKLKNQNQRLNFKAVS